MRFEREDYVDRAVSPQPRCHARLLVRASLIELYLDQVLIQCFSLPDETTGRVVMIMDQTGDAPETLTPYRMTLDE